MNFRQHPLPISWNFSKDQSSFIVSECNEYAYRWLEKWPFKIHDNFVCLVGERGSGKSHLSNIWANRIGADIIHADSDVFSKWFDISSNENQKLYFVLDDADNLNDDILLFYIYNTIKDKNGYLLMTAKTAPIYWNVKLKDIISRLSTVSLINIKRPDESTLLLILKKILNERGIEAKDEILKYVINRIDRNYESLMNVSETIDRELIKRNIKLSFNNIKTILDL